MLKAAAAALMAYELGALATGRVPTLTQVCARHRALAPVLVAALAVHLWRQPRPYIPGGSVTAYRAHVKPDNNQSN